MEQPQRPYRTVTVSQGGTTVSWTEGEPSMIRITETKPNFDAQVMEHPSREHVAPTDFKAACKRAAKALDIVFQLGQRGP